MANRIDKILIQNPDWDVKKVDFSAPKMKDCLEKFYQKQQESQQRKELDPAKLKLVVKL